MSKKKITYTPIVPLIGGLPLGMSKALDGQLPEQVLSYSPFAANDSHYVNYLRDVKKWKGDYVFLDENPNFQFKPVDVVGTTCPCAGLSSLSHASSSDNSINEWMYTSAEFVLSKMKPKVFWGENAPRLYSEIGRPVRERLYAIGKQNGYSLNVYYTESRVHGLSQKRPRSFYFFTQGDRAPILPTWKRPQESVLDTLNIPTDANDLMNVTIRKTSPLDNGWIRFLMHYNKAETLLDLCDKVDVSRGVLRIIEKQLSGDFKEAIQWLIQNGYAKEAEHGEKIMAKKAAGKGYWAHSMVISTGEIPSLISILIGNLVNPTTNKFITLRDAMRLMKLPDDFNLYGDDPIKSHNHICQNVPVTTAGDMMSGIVSYLNGECELSNSSFILQNNKQLSYRSELEAPTASLSDFL